MSAPASSAASSVSGVDRPQILTSKGIDEATVFPNGMLTLIPEERFIARREG